MSAGSSIGAGGPFASAPKRSSTGSRSAAVGQRSIPSGRELTPDVDRICAVVCALYGVALPDILKARVAE